MKTRRILSLMLVLALLLPVLPSASAYREIQLPESGNCVRIRYAGSGRYLDSPAEGLSENGTQVQLWDFAYGNQNQIWYMTDTGDGWQIQCMANDKVLEIRDSSHKDYAQAATWDWHNGHCARWEIIQNENGTVSFKNKESGKFLNVFSGEGGNGNKLIQYHDDGTVAKEFYLELACYEDVLGAAYKEDEEKIRENMEWEKMPWWNNVINKTGYWKQEQGKTYYPTPGQKVFVSVEFLSPATVGNIIRSRSYTKSQWQQFLDLLKGELAEEAVAALLKQLAIDNIPGLGIFLGIPAVFSQKDSDRLWNQFLDTAGISREGAVQGVVVTTYYIFEEEPDSHKTGERIITKRLHTEYRPWTGKDFADVCRLPDEAESGQWYYTFQ